MVAALTKPKKLGRRHTGKGLLERPVDKWAMPDHICRTHGSKGDNYVVNWKKKIEFDNGDNKKTMWFSTSMCGSKEEAKKRAWSYLVRSTLSTWTRAKGVGLKRHHFHLTLDRRMDTDV